MLRLPTLSWKFSVWLQMLNYIWSGDAWLVRTGLVGPIVSAACTRPGFPHSVGSPKNGLPRSLGVAP